METLWGGALWRQLGAAVDALDAALAACPDRLWTGRLWPGPPPPGSPPPFAEFWYVAYHALVWLDLYLAGVPKEDFVPPPPFARGTVDSPEALPDRPYAREELRAYLAAVRGRCAATLVGLTEEQARRPVAYPWQEGRPMSFLELQLYSMRHAQEHAAQLGLFLGQHAGPDAGAGWVTRANAPSDTP